MEWASIRHIAHRCGGRLAPENTLEGLRAAADHGFRAVEFDVMLSGDGTPYLIHDESLERTTGGHGRVAATGDSVLDALYANRGREDRFPAVRLPRLDAAISCCRALGLAMNVEIKPAAGHEVATAQAVVASLVAAGNGATPTLLSSFSSTALAIARARLPDLPSALLVDVVPADWRRQLLDLGCTGLHVAARQPDWAWLDEARALGIAVRCYTVNDRVQATDLFARGIDAVFTDALEVFAVSAGGTAGAG